MPPIDGAQSSGHIQTKTEFLLALKESAQLAKDAWDRNVGEVVTLSDAFLDRARAYYGDSVSSIKRNSHTINFLEIRKKNNGMEMEYRIPTAVLYDKEKTPHDVAIAPSGETYEFTYEHSLRERKAKLSKVNLLTDKTNKRFTFLRDIPDDHNYDDVFEFKAGEVYSLGEGEFELNTRRLETIPEIFTSSFGGVASIKESTIDNKEVYQNFEPRIKESTKQLSDDLIPKLKGTLGTAQRLADGRPLPDQLSRGY